MAKSLVKYDITAANVGDTVVVIKTTQKHHADRTLGSAEIGQRFSVQAVQKDWLWPDYGKPGWIARQDVLPLDEAEHHFTRLISQTPGDARVYRARGSVWLARQNWDRAIEDLNLAIRLDPTDDFNYRERGMAWHHKREYDKAIADFNQAIRLNPSAALYRMNRGAAWENKGDFSQALLDFNAAVRLDPQNGGTHNNLAFLLAACPEGSRRNGPQAVREATTACRLSNWSNYTYLGTLAAAYAETGNFDEAVRWQTKSLELAPEAKQPAWQARLDLYTAGKPYREVGHW